MLKTFEPNNRILFSRYTLVSATISIIPEFTDKIETLGLEDYFDITRNEIINKTTWSSIIFKGLKTGSKIQTANLKSISGLNIWVLDEAEELIEEELFDKINLSIREKNVENKVLLVFNPTTKSHFIYERFFKSKGVTPGSNITKDNITYIHTDYRDNIENLSEDFIKEMEDMKYIDYEKYKNIVLGAFREKAEGLILTNWEYGEFPKNVKAEYGLDFGFNDKNALIGTHIDHKRKLVYGKEELYKSGMSITELVQTIRNIIKSNNLVIADSSAPAIIKDIKDSGINIYPISKTKINEGIEILKNYKLIVDPKSKNLVTELNEYCWRKDYKEGEKAIDDYNHLIDALRYIVTYRHNNKKIKRYGIR